jgi:hypothetical protein
MVETSQSRADKMHFMATTGRNDACPCGSGKKYKKCCLPADDTRRAEAARAAQQAPTLLIEDDGLDDLSNSVLGLLKEDRFDEALAICERLRTEFPDVVDGLEREAMVRAKMGDHARAASLYRQVVDFVTHPSRRDDYEDADYFRELAEKAEGLAAGR